MSEDALQRPNPKTEGRASRGRQYSHRLVADLDPSRGCASVVGPTKPGELDSARAVSQQAPPLEGRLPTIICRQAAPPGWASQVLLIVHKAWVASLFWKWNKSNARQRTWQGG
ncbi:hypothetical protein S40288_11028 [Stachybotrys chartarum IBT 40288]|nr:hypothetical protein S40288_11028 [Stachybotrys chartarum IBT 40288]